MFISDEPSDCSLRKGGEGIHTRLQTAEKVLGKNTGLSRASQIIRGRRRGLKTDLSDAKTLSTVRSIF